MVHMNNDGDSKRGWKGTSLRGRIMGSGAVLYLLLIYPYCSRTLFLLVCSRRVLRIIFSECIYFE